MIIRDLLYSSGICVAHGEIVKLIQSGIVSQGNHIFTYETETIPRPVVIEPIHVGKRKIIMEIFKTHKGKIIKGE